MNMLWLHRRVFVVDVSLARPGRHATSEEELQEYAGQNKRAACRIDQVMTVFALCDDDGYTTSGVARASKEGQSTWTFLT